MATVRKRAAHLVAAAHGVRRVPQNHYSYAEPLKRFLEAFLLALDPEEGVHVEIRPGRPGGPVVFVFHESSVPETGVEELDARRNDVLVPPAGRVWNYYGEIVDGAPLVGLHSYVDRNAKPWTFESLRKAVLAGDVGELDPMQERFRNPYLVGRARALVWTLSPLWEVCGGPRAQAARLAWEALFGAGPWRWRFELRETEPWYVEGDGDGIAPSNPLSQIDATRRRRLSDIIQDANKLYREYAPAPDYVPMRTFKVDGGAESGRRPWLAMLAYYLIEDPTGPGLAPEVAAKALGSTRRHVRRALDALLEIHPNLKTWPKGHDDHGPRIKLGDMGTMSHH